MKTNLPVTGVEKNYADNANILSTTDLKGILTYANEDFVDISGFTLDELQGKNHNIVRHPDMPPAAFENLWSTVKSGKSWMGIVKNRCKNGDHYWVDAYVTPILRDGQPVEYQSVRSKPKKEYLERAEKLYRQLNAGKTPGWLKHAALPFRYRIFGSLAATVLVTLAAMLLAGDVDTVTALTGLGSGLAVAIAAGIWINRPLCPVFAKAREISNNPIARHVYTGRHDEAGQIMMALKYLESEAGGIIGRISDSSHGISDSAEQLAVSIEMNMTSINNQYAETDMVATAVTEMSASIQEVASNAQLTADAASKANDETLTSKQVVNHTMDAIHELASEVEKASTVIRQLEQDSDNISTVVNVISGIAEQTNLLALNAAIEAARAGEQGRGFAVVADEVRTLATRTHDSTQEIQQMIENLQTVARQAATVMEGSRSQADNSVERAREAVASLDAITDAVSSINDMSTQIATAVEQQNAVAQEVNQNIVNIRQTAEITVEGTRTSEKASTKMAQLANELRSLADQFWQKRNS